MSDKIETLEQTFKRLAENPAEFDWESRIDSDVNWDNVTHSLVSHTEAYRKWSQLSEMAQYQYRLLNDELDRIRCGCSQRARIALEGSSQKVTEGRVAELTTLDPAHQNVLSSFREAEHLYEKFRRMEGTMFSHRAMIQSLNARQGRERAWESHPEPQGPDDWEDAKRLYREQKEGL